MQARPPLHDCVKIAICLNLVVFFFDVALNFLGFKFYFFLNFFEYEKWSCLKIYYSQKFESLLFLDWFFINYDRQC